MEPYLNIDRERDFPQLGDVVYADWTGAALPPRCLVEQHMQMLTTQLLGNPHSHHASSTRAMKLVNLARDRVLRFFNADPDEYDVIWTNNASGAILLLQHYLWQGGELLLTATNHNTMNGLREIARREGAAVRYAPIQDDLSIDGDALLHLLQHPRRNKNRVFGFPAKSNYSGHLHSLDWIEVAQEHGWDVILDAAAYLANCKLDLSRHKPEFVPVSFYKLFGYPTGMGCLIVKKEVYERMHKKWFAGGTILLVAVMADFYALEPSSPARYEDGTLPFGQIPAVIGGLEWLENLGNRSAHAGSLAARLYDGLNAMRVGKCSVEIHSPRESDMVTFSVKNGDEYVPAWLVEQAADRADIQFRSGCFCNPGDNEKTMGYTVEEFERTYNDGASAEDFTLEELAKYSDGKPIGALRASFGYANNASDIERILTWMESYLGSL